MKNIFQILATVCLLSACLWSCADSETDLYSSDTTTPTAGIDDNDLNLLGDTEQSKIAIKANIWWKAEVAYPMDTDEEWCEISPKEGFGNIEIDVETSRNYSADKVRTAKIVITSDGDSKSFSKEFTVTQQFNSPYIDIEEVENDGTLNVPLTRSETTLQLKTNQQWKASSSQPDWCTVDTEGTAGSTTLKLISIINSSLTPRTAVITVASSTNPSLSYKFTVNQSATFDVATLQVEKTADKFIAKWTKVLGVNHYLLNLEDANGSLVGSINMGTETICNLALHEIFTTPTYAGFVNISVRAVSEDETIFSTSNTESVNSHFTSGKGTISDPFIIGEMESLNNITIANKVSANAGAHYKLNFAPALPANFKPICTPTEPFTGIFDGNNTTISSWVVTHNADSRNYLAFFGGVAEGATVKNLTFRNCSISLDKGAGSVSATNNGFAFVAATNNGTISGVTTDNCSISCTAETTPLRVGAIVGYNSGTIINANTKGGILSAASNRNKTDVFDCGGITAYNTATGFIENCHNEGTEILAMTNIGGIVGLSDGVVRKCSNSATITGNYYFGGIVGYIISSGNSTFLIEDCCNTGKIVMNEPAGASRGASYVGGIVSRIHSTGDAIRRCFNSGDMEIGASSSSSNLRVGGLVGHVNNTGRLSDSYFCGKMTLAGKANAGGIVGEFAGKATKITNCYSAGQIIIVGGSGNINDAFGLVKETAPIISYCYALNNGGAAFAGTPTANMTNSGYKTDAQMKSTSPTTEFPTWDFSSTWKLSSNTYPYPQLISVAHKK